MQSKKQYLCVRQNGIVRITTNTPANIAGVYFEHIITCVALCLRTPDNKRFSFIHMDAAMNCDSIASEVEWLDNKDWELITFTNANALKEVQTRHNLPNSANTENVLTKYLRTKQLLSHWKRRIDTNTTCAIIERNFKLTTEITTERDYIFFKDLKLAEAIDTINNCLESFCTGGLYYLNLYPAQLDYDGEKAFTEPLMVQEFPALKRRVLHILTAIIAWLPQHELANFVNGRKNLPGTAKIQEFLPDLLKQLFEIQHDSPIIPVLPTIAQTLSLLLQEYLTNPAGISAKQIKDFLPWARALQSINQHYDENHQASFYSCKIVALVLALVSNATQNEEILNQLKVEPFINRSQNFAFNLFPQCNPLKSAATPSLCQSVCDLIHFIRNNPTSEFTIAQKKVEQSLQVSLLKAKQQANETDSTIEQKRPSM